MIKAALKKHWPILILFLLSLILFIVNYHPGKSLLGWDNTIPQYNFSLNFKRIIQSAWQQYRGLGSAQVMSDGANLPLLLIMKVIVLFTGLTQSRYFLQILLHFFGGLGIYFLIENEIKKYLSQIFKIKDFHSKPLALMAAVFYMFNLMTVQMFYTPLEAFNYHFVLLPWGILSLLTYIKKKSKKNLLFLFLVHLLTLPASYVSTFFIVYCVVFFLILFFNLFSKKIDLKHFFIAALTLIIINSAWLLPYLISVKYKTQEVSNSTINLLSTKEMLFKNQDFGDLKSILSFGGFSLDYTDLDEQGNSVFLMDAWHNLYQHHWYQWLNIVLSCLAFLGFFLILFYSFKTKNFQCFPFIVLLGFSFMILANNTVIVREIVNLIYQVPIIGQIFRTPFTKFSLLYVFCLSICLVAIGSFFQAKLKRNNLYFYLVIFLIFTSTLPSFWGHFFYQRLFVNIPDAYFELNQFLSNSYPNAKVAIFPLYDFWGWDFHDWGYRGSGFSWQMIEQSLLHRTFDPHSKTSEEFYLEILEAFYSLDYKAFQKVLDKYHVQFFLIDRSLIYKKQDKDMDYLKIRAFLKKVNAELVFEKDNLFLFYYGQNTGLEKNVTALGNYKLTNNYFDYQSRDSLYQNLSPINYIYSADNQNTIYYPFAHIRQKRPLDLAFVNERLVLNSSIYTGKEKKLTIPALAEKQKYFLPAKIFYQENQVILEFPYFIEVVFANNRERVMGIPRLVVEVTAPDQEIILNINDQEIELSKDQTKEIVLDNLIIGEPIALATYSQDKQNIKENIFPKQIWNNVLREKYYTLADDVNEISLVLPVLKTEYDLDQEINNCDVFGRGTVDKKKVDFGVIFEASNNGVTCSNIALLNSSTKYDSILYLKGENITGRNMLFKIYNKASKYNEFSYLPRDSIYESYLFLPAKEKFDENIYEVHLDNKAYQNIASKNYLSKIVHYQLPVSDDWISSIVYENPNTQSIESAIDIQNLDENNYWRYSASLNVKNDTSILALGQSYDPGWVAYVRGKSGQKFEHVLVNNWANGWKVPSGEYEIVIKFWPQQLVYLGYGLLGCLFIYLIFFYREPKIVQEELKVKQAKESKIATVLSRSKGFKEKLNKMILEKRPKKRDYKHHQVQEFKGADNTIIKPLPMKGDRDLLQELGRSKGEIPFVANETLQKPVKTPAPAHQLSQSQKSAIIPSAASKAPVTPTAPTTPTTPTQRLMQRLKAKKVAGKVFKQ